MYKDIIIKCRARLKCGLLTDRQKTLVSNLEIALINGDNREAYSLYYRLTISLSESITL